MIRSSLTVLLIAGLGAQESQVAAKAQVIRFDATTMVIPAGQHELRALIDASARFLQRNILCDDNELAAARRHTVELQSPLTLDVKVCEEALSQLLYSCDVVLVPRDLDKGLYEAIHLQGPRGREAFNNAPRRSVEAILAQPHLQQPVTTVLKLRQVNVTVATNSLRPFFAQAALGQGLTLGTNGTNDALILTGLQSRVADAISMVHKIDGDDEPAAPAPAEAKSLAAQIAALERSVQELTQRIAALELAGKK